MNQTLTTAEIEALAIPLPAPAMTKKEKLLRFAEIIRKAYTPEGRDRAFVIFHGLEYVEERRLAEYHHPHSAFTAAGMDPVLQRAGLKKDAIGGYDVSALEAKRFFELSQKELHEFSCDCGGVISNLEMADRIERIAARS